MKRLLFFVVLPFLSVSMAGAHTWTYWRMELPFVLEFVSKSLTQS